MRDNPLSDLSRNTHIPALLGRGVGMSFGASKPAVEEIELDRIPEDWEAGDNIHRRRMEMRQDMIR